MIQKHFANLIPLFLMATALGTAFGQQATFYPSKDTSIYQESENSNALGTGLYVGKNTQDNLRRALLAFDLTSIPQGSTITSVTLQMKVTRANGQTGPIVVAVHRVTRDWGEGTSLAPGEGGQGGAPTVTDATWNHALYPNSNWAAEGGDYTESPSETTVVGVTDTTPVWTGTSELIADVQGWVNNPASNFGWILIGGEGTTGGAKRLGSREAETIEARPRLLIEYEEAVIPDTIYFPQFGNGTGFFSQITLSSIDSDEVTSAVVSLRDGAGNPLDTVLNGQPTVDGELSISVPAGGSVVLQSDATGDVKTGSVTVSSDRPLFGVIVFGGSFGLAGVGSSEHPSNNLVGPVEVSESGQINTGVAIHNLAETQTLTLELIDREGTVIDTAGVAISQLGHRALMLNELSWANSTDLSEFGGTLRIKSDRPEASLVATMIQLRIVEGMSQYATLPVRSER